jgi:VCBS repeat-containing protein
VAGSYGTFSLNSAGVWTYTLDNANTDVQALGAGDSLTETFTAVSVDGSASEVITITINGTNDIPTLGGVVSGSVTEDGATLASGTLTVSDVDAGESSFAAQSNVAGSYGTFSLNSAGVWTYTLDNANTDVQALGAGDSLTETFTAVSVDGSASEVITITINGTNDIPTLGGVVSGNVTEDGATLASGTLTVSDVDAGESSFTAQSNVAGSYGTFSLNSAGVWTYTLDNANTDVQALGAGDSLT